MRKLIIIALSVVIASCAYFEEDEDETIDWTADRLYNEARAAMDSGNWKQAVGLYEKLEARYPFGKYGQQAVLDLAYA
ncbi:MAG: tetratricopeptide repeat protein, partial [Thiotrichales bacterium]|nr:tetratricopeptide repeat protein [Thiotrichales bacterium]